MTYLVSGVLNDHKSESIISAVIVLAEGFNVPLIAEGIENEYVRERLIDLGCTKAQGYHFSRPARFDTYHCEDGIFIYAQ
ncbi:EAL domain-containing protein [Buttiauxella noackiae]|uniref:EAL domain-containing protein n=1 Tax=Buttiauxella noackiae TaxID=82992 RepID=UPI0035A6C544